jgi:hypothetical protein
MLLLWGAKKKGTIVQPGMVRLSAMIAMDKFNASGHDGLRGSGVRTRCKLVSRAEGSEE